MFREFINWLREYKHPYYTITYRGGHQDAQRHTKLDNDRQRRTKAPKRPTKG